MNICKGSAMILNRFYGTAFQKGTFHIFQHFLDPRFALSLPPLLSLYSSISVPSKEFLALNPCTFIIFEPLEVKRRLRNPNARSLGYSKLG